MNGATLGMCIVPMGEDTARKAFLYVVFWERGVPMGTMKDIESEAKIIEKKVVQLEQKIVKNKMSTLGTVASVLAICMYVSYIPQIIGNLSGHPGDWIQPFVAFINCTLWVIYGLFRKKPEWPIVVANVPGIIFGLTAAITARM